MIPINEWSWRRKLTVIFAVFAITFALSSTISNAQTYIHDDSVIFEDDNIYYKATPHTIYEDGWVYIDFISKKYTGDIDVAFGFDTDVSKPKTIERWAGTNWTTFGSDYEIINKDYDNKDRWYFLYNKPITKEIEYKLRVWIDINEFSSGKYDFAIKPSSETLQESINNGHFYLLDPWWNSAYKSCINITADAGEVATTLSDFAGMLVLNDSNIDYAVTQNNGEDIRIVNTYCDNGGTQVAHEIEIWNESGDSIVWFKFDTLDSVTNTTYSLYFNNSGVADGQNATGVWDSNYVAVYHMNDFTTSLINDSTANALTGTKNGANNPTQINGLIGNAQICDGSNDFISLGYDITFTDGATVEMWLNSNVGTDSYIALAKRWKSYGVQTFTNEPGFEVRTAGGYYHVTINETLRSNNGTWIYIAFTYDGEDLISYLDGALIETDGTPSGNIITDIHPTILAFSSTTDIKYKGIMDEVRMSYSARSSDWIATTHKMLTGQIISLGSIYVTNETTPETVNTTSCDFPNFVTVGMLHKECDSGTLIYSMNWTNGDNNCSYTQTQICDNGCLDNVTCLQSESSDTQGIATIVVIAFGILMIIFTYLSIKVGEEHWPMQMLFLALALIFGAVLINSLMIIMTNIGQTTLAGHIETIYSGYVIISIFIGFYYAVKFFQFIAEKMAQTKAEKKRKREEDD